MEVEMEKGHYLNDEQKEIKGKIMEDLMTSFYKRISDNQDKFTVQSLTDVVLSSLIMFAREVIVHFLNNSTARDEESKLMIVNQILISIGSEVKSRLDEKENAS